MGGDAPGRAPDAPPDRGCDPSQEDEAIADLIGGLARLPGLGRRSATRAALRLLGDRERYLRPLVGALNRAAQEVRACELCGNLDSHRHCRICRDPRRDGTLLCVVEAVDDLWALERSAVFRGRYHVLGGTLSALDGRGPESLSLAALKRRVEAGAQERAGAPAGARIREVILALGATVEGQTTAHYIADSLRASGCTLSVLGQGLPVGGSLNYLDDGTLFAAFRSRAAL